MSYNSTEPGAGGKMIRRKQQRLASRTPYDRPPPVVKPNWLSSAGHALLSGAGKLISSVIGSDSDESDSDESDDEVDSQDGRLDTEEQRVKFSSATKDKIVELIMMETFSREEGDALIQIIRSQTVDSLMLSENQDAQLNNQRDEAVIEARKWIEERKQGESSKSHLEFGSGSLSALCAPRITKEAGSPVDVARTYMRVRPPWASPTVNLSEIKSPTNVKIQTVTDASSFPSVGAVSSSQTRKRDLLVSGSWSIAEEVRKVRARATDELLSTPSRKFDLSDFSLNREANSDTVKYGQDEKIAGSNSFTLALAEVADNATGPAAEAPMSTRSTSMDTIVEVPQQEPLSFALVEKMDQMPDTLSTEGARGSDLHEDKNGVEDDIITSANDLQGMPSMAGVTTESTADTHNIGYEDGPDHSNNVNATSEIPSNEEHTSKSSPELLLPSQATKKPHRVKQPVRLGRGRSRGK